jgi:hypothetical protein
VDDSCARHQGNNGFVTHIGNDLFGWFQSTEKSVEVRAVMKEGVAEIPLSA